MREVVIVVALASFFGCHKDEPPPPPVPSATASVSAAPIQSAAEPLPSASASSTEPRALPGVPPVELACAKDTDCGPAFWSDACCNQCEPRVGTKAWAKKLDAFCTKPENKGSGCGAPKPCGFAFGAPRCSAGKCVAK